MRTRALFAVHRDWRHEGRSVMAGCWQTPTVSLPVRLRRPAWRTTAARALPAELMASLSLIPQLITSARSSLMKESPHRDEKRRGGGRERFGRERECEKVKEKERLHCGNKKQIEKGQKEKWQRRGRASKWGGGKKLTLCERKWGEGGAGVPVGK